MITTALLYDMAQIYQQRAADSLDADDLAHAKRYRMAGDRIAELEAENAALREDAERYRWLRDQPMYPTWKLIAASSNNREAIIDAAMGKFQASPIDAARRQP